jgi:hypothetical protein
VGKINHYRALNGLMFLYGGVLTYFGRWLDIRAVLELLGHKDVTMKMIYTHVFNRGERESKARQIPSDLLVTIPPFSPPIQKGDRSPASLPIPVQAFLSQSLTIFGFYSINHFPCF